MYDFSAQPLLKSQFLHVEDCKAVIPKYVYLNFEGPLCQTFLMLWPYKTVSEFLRLSYVKLVMSKARSLFQTHTLKQKNGNNFELLYRGEIGMKSHSLETIIKLRVFIGKGSFLEDLRALYDNDVLLYP